MMKRVLFCPTVTTHGTLGSPTTCVALAVELRALGMECGFVAGGYVGDFARRYGFAVYDSPLPQTETNLRAVNTLDDALYYMGLLDEVFLAGMVEAELSAIREFQPDLVFTDFRLTPAISTRVTQVQAASIASWPIHPNFPGNDSSPERATTQATINNLLRKYHLPEVANYISLFFTYSDLKLAPTLPFFEPQLADIANLDYIGGIFFNNLESNLHADPLPEQWLAGSKRIFTYFSVSGFFPDLYTQLLPWTFDGSDYQVLCAVGYGLKGSLPEQTSNVSYIRMADPEEVLPKADLLIFHGGQGTALASIYLGCPTLAIPGRNLEREFNAAMLEQLGCGQVMPANRLRPKAFLRTVQEMFEHLPQYRAAIKGLQTEAQKYTGPRMGAEIIRKFLEKGDPQ